jgi:hypothetical protein
MNGFHDDSGEFLLGQGLAGGTGKVPNDDFTLLLFPEKTWRVSQERL